MRSSGDDGWLGEPPWDAGPTLGRHAAGHNGTQPLEGFFIVRRLLSPPRGRCRIVAGLSYISPAQSPGARGSWITILLFRPWKHNVAFAGLDWWRSDCNVIITAAASAGDAVILAGFGRFKVSDRA